MYELRHRHVDGACDNYQDLASPLAVLDHFSLRFKLLHDAALGERPLVLQLQALKVRNLRQVLQDLLDAYLLGWHTSERGAPSPQSLPVLVILGDRFPADLRHLRSINGVVDAHVRPAFLNSFQPRLQPCGVILISRRLHRGGPVRNPAEDGRLGRLVGLFLGSPVVLAGAHRPRLLQAAPHRSHLTLVLFRCLWLPAESIWVLLALAPHALPRCGRLTPRHLFRAACAGNGTHRGRLQGTPLRDSLRVLALCGGLWLASSFGLHLRRRRRLHLLERLLDPIQQWARHEVRHQEML
mmetsp:Transcript_88019/g.249367  ORF Transcript_88019/g.249367 Transcript_88019/m.249367 type:complete len:296 (+) Transcript_88019:2339-3226(+)